MKVAIIGSRRINPSQANYLIHVASAFARRGWTIKTGGAEGADFASMVGTRKINPNLLEVYLPWKTYNKDYHNGGGNFITYDPTAHAEWKESVYKYHPAPAKLSRGGFSLHARNFGIIQGADIVVAMPMSDDDLGGTGQGIRIAQDLNIPLYLVHRKEDRQKLKSYIESIKIPNAV